MSSERNLSERNAVTPAQLAAWGLRRVETAAREKTYQKHLQRVRDMPANVDNKPPPVYKHLSSTTRAPNKYIKEKQVRIAYENHLLVKHLHQLFSSDRFLLSSPPYQLNRNTFSEQRLRDLKKVETENQSIAFRINRAFNDSYYSRKRLDMERERNERAMRNMSMYPVPKSSRLVTGEGKKEKKIENQGEKTVEKDEQEIEQTLQEMTLSENKAEQVEDNLKSSSDPNSVPALHFIDAEGQISENPAPQAITTHQEAISVSHSEASLSDEAKEDASTTRPKRPMSAAPRKVRTVTMSAPTRQNYTTTTVPNKQAAVGDRRPRTATDQRPPFMVPSSVNEKPIITKRPMSAFVDRHAETPGQEAFRNHSILHYKARQLATYRSPYAI